MDHKETSNRIDQTYRANSLATLLMQERARSKSLQKEVITQAKRSTKSSSSDSKNTFSVDESKGFQQNGDEIPFLRSIFDEIIHIPTQEERKKKRYAKRRFIDCFKNIFSRKTKSKSPHKKIEEKQEEWVPLSHYFPKEMEHITLVPHWTGEGIATQATL